MPGGNPRKKKTLKDLLNQLAISTALAAVVLLFTQDFLFEFSPLNRLELSTIDYRFRLRGTLPLPADSLKVVIVEISEESFKSLPGKWPWPRSYYARLVRNLKRAGALAVGIDIVFDAGDAVNPANDEELRKAIRETGDVVLAGKTEISTGQYTILRARENYSNIFFDVDSSIGIVYVRSDDDGVYRRYQPFAVDPASQRRIPTFSFAVLNKVFDKPPLDVALNVPGEFIFGDRRIPKFDDASTLINYYGADRTFRRIKFADVIDDRDFTTREERETGEEINTFDDPEYGYLYDGTFAGKVVLVGPTMPEFKDLFPVSIGQGKQEGDNLMYGVEIHANVIQNVLDANFLRKEPRWVEVLLVLVFSILTFFASTRLKEIKFRYQGLKEFLGALVMMAELALIGFASVKLFSEYGYLITLVSPSLSVIVGFVGATAYNYVTERRQKVLIKGMFSTYVNPTVVNQLIEHPERLRLGGERKELTVLFSDIAGFTTISEIMQPEDLVALLNEYLSAMTAIIFANGGTLDKYEGDAVMAFWGAPIPQSDHALRACRAALQMQEALIGMREGWKEGGKPYIDVRIGLSTGIMVVGNMGGTRRFDYTVMGDSVNLGSRLEGANKEYRTKIMISEITHQHVREQVVARQLDLLVVKGKTAPLAVYELVGLMNDTVSPEYLEFLSIYNRGLQQYRKREWQAAVQSFRKALEILPEDYPSLLYIDRAKTYEETPPPPEWDGVYVLKTK